MKISFRPAAREDILKQVRYYVEIEGVSHVAKRFLESVEKSTKQLQRMPRIGAPRFVANPVLEGLRTWGIVGFDQIRLYYVPTATEIEVLRILHDKRDIEEILGRE